MTPKELREWAWHLYDKAARFRPGQPYTKAVWKIHLAASGTFMREGNMAVKTKEKPQLVVATYEMDTEQFCLHFTHRHGDSLAGMPGLPPDISFEVEQAYRAFHFRLHATRTNYKHEHEEDPPEAGIERAIECLLENHAAGGWYEIAGVDGHVAVFPDTDEIATRVNGQILYHDDAQEATDRLMAATKPVKAAGRPK